MSKKLAIVLIAGGLLVGAITWLGSQQVNKKSDVEIIREGLMEQKEREEQRRNEALDLGKKVILAPETCKGLTTKFVYDYCETEPYGDAPWGEWKAMANAEEQVCIIDSFHQTNAYAFAIEGKVYEKPPAENQRFANFISDLCGASLFTENVDWGDTDKPLSTLIDGFYAYRAETFYGPRKDY